MAVWIREVACAARVRQALMAGLLLGLTLQTAPLSAAGSARGGGRAEIDALLTKRLPALLETYEHLHRNPELSFHEEETAVYVATRLRKLGYAVTESFGTHSTPDHTAYGVVATLRNGKGPTVLLRADMDALPVVEQTGLPYASRVLTTDDGGEQVGVMHACGHDMHMTVLLGTAEMLKALAHRWRGTLLLVAQQAEELGSGARAMLNGGLYEKFPRPDYGLAMHLDAGLEAGKIGVRSGFALANVNGVDITVRGVGGHGAYPHTTQDPVVVAAQTILALQTLVSRQISPLDPAVVTVGSIHGGTKRNIIPDEVKLQLTVRSYKPEVREALLSGIRRTAQGVARAAGIPPERAPIVTESKTDAIPATYNDPKLTDRVAQAMTAALGKASVVPKDPVMGGEDFGIFALPERTVPVCMLWLGAQHPELLERQRQGGEPAPSLHSSRFAPPPKPTLLTGVRGMTVSALHLLGDRPES